MVEVLVTSDGTTDLYPITKPFWGRLRFIQVSGPPVRGCFSSTEEELGTVAAEIGDYKTLDAPFIDVKKLSREEVANALLKLVPEQYESPSLTEMVTSFSEDMLKWASANFALASQEEMDQRLNICRSCEWWNAEAYKGTGRCRKCGCSTWAKIRVKTSGCPIGLWGRIQVEDSEKPVTLSAKLQ